MALMGKEHVTHVRLFSEELGNKLRCLWSVRCLSGIKHQYI